MNTSKMKFPRVFLVPNEFPMIVPEERGGKIHFALEAARFPKQDRAPAILTFAEEASLFDAEYFVEENRKYSLDLVQNHVMVGA